MRHLGRWILLGWVTALCSCTTRTLDVSSTPEGAEIVVNGELLGRTPLVIPFRYGGEVEIIFYREGYSTVTIHHDTHKWAYDVFPLDVVVDFSPFGAEDRQSLHVDLRGAPDLSQRDPDELRQAVLERAGELRQRSERAELEAPPLGSAPLGRDR